MRDFENSFPETPCWRRDIEEPTRFHFIVAAVLLIATTDEHQARRRDPPEIRIRRLAIGAVRVRSAPEFYRAINWLRRERNSVQRDKWRPAGVVSDLVCDCLSEIA